MGPNTLKIMAGDIVSQSKLSKPAKLQLLNWLQNEATEVQVKGLLLDGEMYVDIDEDTEKLINKRFDYNKQIQEAYRQFEGKFKKFLQYGIAILVTNVAWPLGAFGMWLYRQATDTCVKNCGGLSQAERKCINLCYLKASKKVLEKFKGEKGKLSSIKDEKKRASISKKLDKQIQKWEQRVDKYETRMRASAQDVVVSSK
jgi:hypothetical protein